jgi:hypothetical protein
VQPVLIVPPCVWQIAMLPNLCSPSHRHVSRIVRRKVAISHHSTSDMLSDMFFFEISREV